MTTNAITLLQARKKNRIAAQKQHVAAIILADLIRFFLRYISAQPVNR